MFLRQAIDQIKDAPKEVQLTKESLNCVESTITRIDELQVRAAQANIDVFDISSDIAFCRKAIESLELHIKPTFDAFQLHNGSDVGNASQGSQVDSRKGRRAWRRLKAAFESPKMKDLVTQLEQSKTQLLGAQTNMIQ